MFNHSPPLLPKIVLINVILSDILNKAADKFSKKKFDFAPKLPETNFDLEKRFQRVREVLGGVLVCLWRFWKFMVILHFGIFEKRRILVDVLKLEYLSQLLEDKNSLPHFRKLIFRAFRGWLNVFCTVLTKGALGHQSWKLFIKNYFFSG